MLKKLYSKHPTFLLFIPLQFTFWKNLHLYPLKFSFGQIQLKIPAFGIFLNSDLKLFSSPSNKHCPQSKSQVYSGASPTIKGGWILRNLKGTFWLQNPFKLV